MVDPPGEPSVVISTQTTIFHGASYSLNFDDEPQQPLKITYISVADAKKLASKPTGTVAALNPYFLPLSRLKTKNTHSLTPSQSRPMLCSSHDFHIKYPRDEALYVFFFCEHPASDSPYHGHFARVSDRLHLPHPLPPTDLVGPFTNDVS